MENIEHREGEDLLPIGTRIVSRWKDVYSTDSRIQVTTWEVESYRRVLVMGRRVLAEQLKTIDVSHEELPDEYVLPLDGIGKFVREITVARPSE